MFNIFSKLFTDQLVYAQKLSLKVDKKKFEKDFKLLPTACAVIIKNGKTKLFYKNFRIINSAFAFIAVLAKFTILYQE